MENAKMSAMIKGLVVFVAFLWLLPSVAEAQAVNCDEASLQAAINAAGTGATLLVSGTCNENVVIREEKNRITVDGQGMATINGPDASDHTVTVRGRGITIRRFTISGGRNGVQVIRGGTATIEGNIIQNTGNNGINVSQHSSARIINNTVQNNPNNDGVTVNENSEARIGFLSPADAVASPNTITMNGRHGIGVFRSSNARIVGNTISSNTEDGIRVARASHADIASNTIEGNSGDGIFVSQNSGVNLGSDTGTTIFDLPNDTTVGSENGGFGIRCAINSYGDGRQGTLNGTMGAKSFNFDPPGPNDGGCHDSLLP